MFVGCAGGADLNVSMQFKEDTYIPEGDVAVKISLTGLKGGHSGVDIHLGRANANKLMFRFLKEAVRDYGARLSSVDGGSLRNAIPREAFAVITIPGDNVEALWELVSDYQEMYGDLYNLEATPAESTTYRLAKHDKKRWPGIKTAGHPGDTPYYTNSSHLPVDYTVDIFDALDIQDELQTLYTSGTVFHAFLGEKLPDWKAAANLVKTIAENYKLPYYTISPTYSVCSEHGYLSGEHFTCPKCGKKAEVYSRITGYYRPVQNWNDGKAQEYKNRTLYDVVHSSLKKVHTSVVTMTEDDVKVQPVETHKYLFTTSTCPNCRMAKKMLEGEELEIIDAEQNPDMARQFGIMQAPTLVITDGEHLKKYVNASNIQKYVDEEL